MNAQLFICDTFWDSIQLLSFPLTIGRGPLADVRLDDFSLSERHCQIDRLDNALIVRDLRSRSGISINGVKVRQSLLLPGDRLTVGDLHFIVSYKQRPEGRWVSDEDVNEDELEMAV